MYKEYRYSTTIQYEQYIHYNEIKNGRHYYKLRVQQQMTFFLSRLHILQIACFSSLFLYDFSSSILSLSLSRPIWASGLFGPPLSQWEWSACIDCFSAKKFYSSECVSAIIYPCEVTSLQLRFLSSCELFSCDV